MNLSVECGSEFANNAYIVPFVVVEDELSSE